MDTNTSEVLELELHSVQETEELAASWARQCLGGELIVLDGELGAGKTTFVRGFARGLGCDASQIRSPSAILHHRHEGRRVLHHFDVYFTESTLDLERTPVRDFLAAGEVVALEWGRRIAEWLPGDHLGLELGHEGPECRRAVFTASGAQGKAWMKRFLDAQDTESV